MLNDRVVAWDRINRARNEPKLIREKFHSIEKKKSHVELTHLRKFGGIDMCGLCKSCCSVETRDFATIHDVISFFLTVLCWAIKCTSSFACLLCGFPLHPNDLINAQQAWETKQQSPHKSSYCRPSTLLQYPFIVLYNTAPCFLNREVERRKIGIRHREKKEESLLTFR